MEGDVRHGRGRSPRRVSASPPHSRDVSPNWSEVSDHSPPRLITPQPRRPSADPAPHPRPGGRRSPLRGGGGRRARRKDALAEETASVRLEVLCVVLQVLAAGAALLQGVCLALVTAAWQHQGPQVCPLYVTRPPGFGIHWGNEDLTPCKAAAFLPILVAALALTLAASHACVLHVWRLGGHAPAASASKVYAGVTVALVTLQVVVALAAALVLTEGFRQTCVSFDLSLSWNETPESCRRRLEQRDASYQLSGTFARLVAGLVGGWACVALTATLTLACCVRAGLCSIRLLCI